MIQIMIDADKEISNFSSLYHMFSGILKAMEEQGMLPPLNNWSLYTDGDNADTKSIIYRTWEPEDDSSKEAKRP